MTARREAPMAPHLYGLVLLLQISPDCAGAPTGTDHP